MMLIIISCKQVTLRWCPGRVFHWKRPCRWCERGDVFYSGWDQTYWRNDQSTRLPDWGPSSSHSWRNTASVRSVLLVLTTLTCSSEKQFTEESKFKQVILSLMCTYNVSVCSQCLFTIVVTFGFSVSKYCKINYKSMQNSQHNDLWKVFQYVIIHYAIIYIYI